MDYIEVTCHFLTSPETLEMVTSVLASAGFEGFLEEEDRLQAYIPAPEFKPGLLESIKFPGGQSFHVHFSIHRITEQNWNQQWESSYDPVRVKGTCQIRAPFHPPQKGIPYDIVIEPRMSFGTAHHATTKLMIEALLQLDVKGKNVLDMGCGTGVLAILADKMGASCVKAVDNDEWAYANATDNILKNNTSCCSVYLGDASLAGKDEFDLILANINRNTLLKDIPLYAEGLREKGLLIISGFYGEDTGLLNEAARASKLEMSHIQSKGDWALIQYSKKEIH